MSQPAVPPLLHSSTATERPPPPPLFTVGGGKKLLEGVLNAESAVFRPTSSSPLTSFFRECPIPFLPSLRRTVTFFLFDGKKGTCKLKGYLLLFFLTALRTLRFFILREPFDML